MIKYIRALSLMMVCSFFTACAHNVSMDYSPKTTAEVKGAVAVNTFKYFKAHASDDNEVGCNKLNCLHLTETVSDYVTNAVKREFRQAGISLINSRCNLDGEINEYSVNPGIFDVTYRSNIRYILNTSSGKTLFDNDYKVEFDAAGTHDATLAFNNLNKALSDNINKLMNDSDFTASLKKNCQ
jgi:hypothetical protein